MACKKFNRVFIFFSLILNKYNYFLFKKEFVRMAHEKSSDLCVGKHFASPRKEKRKVFAYYEECLFPRT